MEDHDINALIYAASRRAGKSMDEEDVKNLLPNKNMGYRKILSYPDSYEKYLCLFHKLYIENTKGSYYLAALIECNRLYNLYGRKNGGRNAGIFTYTE